MSRTRSAFALFALLALFVCGTASAAATLGRDYTRLKQPQATESGNKVEVIEFFWYGCPHCYHLDPPLNAWVKKLPKDVEFRRIPAIPSPRWAPLARVYYSLDAMGELDRLHGKVFDAIHRDHVNLNDEKGIADWMARQGVDRKKFLDAWNSFSVQSKVRRAAQLTEAYNMDSVPMLVIDGKYATGPSMTGGEDQLFAVMDELVAKARSERGGKR